MIMNDRYKNAETHKSMTIEVCIAYLFESIETQKYMSYILLRYVTYLHIWKNINMKV